MTGSAYRAVRLRTFALAVATALLCAVCSIGTWSHAPAFADDDTPSLNAWNYKNVYLEPGDRYDIGDSWTINTRVHITKPGEYRLHGSSTIATVRITTGGVTVYLEDGLNINPYGFANGQTAVSAITVEANSGDVRLVSKANATVKLDGYLEAPGVNKVGQGSRLVFETEDPARPGHIICDRSGTKLKPVHTPGIGTVDPMRADVRNIVFKSGKVTAKGYGNAAGIGSASYATRHEAVTGISIEGTAEVVAVGGNGGAPGIGSVRGDTSVTIKDNAKVTATGTESAPGIGSGSAVDTCAGRRVSVTISGGTVTAQGGKNAPGIGSTEGTVDDITISGGTVTAKGGEDAPGIGSTTGSVDAVVISGGTVTATRNGDSPGIGTGYLNTGTTRIEISGGFVSTPSAQKNKPAIGTTSSASTTDVRISGGTVDVLPGVIGMPKKEGDDYGSSKVTINGGTVRTESLAIYPAPVNSNGDRVRPATVSLENTDSGAVSSLTVKELNGYSYGTKDLELRGGHLYIWLPQGGAITEASHENNNCFSGTIIVGESAVQGTLYLSNNVILDSGGDGMTDGSARASDQATHLANVSAPTTAEDGYVASSYLSPDRLIPVVDAATNQVVAGDDRYVDAASGTWIYEGAYPVTLLTRWKPVTYGIVYDANIPDDASTAGQAQGRMLPKDNLTFGDDYTLTPNQFSLPGYKFVGWSLKPDGDVDFSDRKTITGEGIVVGSDGGPYTLYAQWEPLTYDVTFTSGNEVSGDAYTQTLKFDEEDDLDAVLFKSDAYRFAGWTSSDGTVYADGATALNLCAVNDDGTLTGCILTAHWVTDDHVTVVITCDDEPVEIPDPEDNIALVPIGGTDAEGDDEITGFTEKAAGIYACDNVPGGTYGIDLDPSAGEYATSGITIKHEQGSNTTVTLAYYTATVNNVEDGHVRAYLNYPTSTGTSTITVLSGTQATLWAGADDGYAFDGYTCVGVTPPKLDTENGENQTITITGTVEITPHARAARYAIEFNANAPSSASSAVHGEMATADVAYGDEFALPKNTFRLNGYTFTGWNTEADGTGILYADAQAVKDLADADNETVTLYAQWKANHYKISFESNKPAQASTAISGSMDYLTLSYDSSSNLTANAFSLPGYTFTGWNTEADGTGAAFADGAAVRNLSSVDDAHIVLYAQWQPLTYTISFDAGDGTGTMEAITVAFDETAQLPGCEFAYDKHVFSHWSGLALGSSYSDGAYVKNLCGTPGADGELSPVTLTANWMEASATAVVVRLNGAADPNLTVDDVELKNATRETTFECSSLEGDRFVFEGLPDGEGPLGSFVINIEGYDAGEAVVQRGETVTLDFYTVSINAGDGVASVWLGNSAAPVEELPNVRAGTVVRIGATATTGYVFDGYTATGTNPTWDPSTAEQAIIINGAAEITAHARAAEYTVSFDANAPARASTAAQLSGSMADQPMTYGIASTLTTNAFALPGYSFAGWNTAADGTGTAFEDGTSVQNLTPEDGATVTLYAQWIPLEYTITYDSGDEGGETTRTATFDKAFALPSTGELGFSPSTDMSFVGWSTGALGHYYLAGEEVVNLCSIGDDGTLYGITLVAQWADASATTIVVTDDGTPSSRFTADDIALEQNGVSYKNPIGSDGVFSFDGTLPTGTFTVVVDDIDTGIKVTKGASVKVAYCTVETSAELGARMRLFEPGTGATVESPAFVLVDSAIGIETTVDEGYAFESYTAIGAQPSWEDGDPTKASQIVTVRGQTLIEAHPTTVRYTVQFDANGGTGTMENQDMVYGEPQNLFANAFTRSGYVFTGWNTEADGSGESYADGEQVISLTAENGSVVTLYAQWSSVAPPLPTTYPVEREVAGHGTVSVDPERAAAGATVTISPQPDEGYGLFSIEAVGAAGSEVPIDENEDGTYSFTMPASTVTVEATFKVILPFPDLDWHHWGYDNIALAYERGLMTGLDSGLYGADLTTTRAMAVTVIWRLAGCPQASSDLPFSDVTDDTWYTEAVRWAAEAGITTGYDGTDLFGPDDELTREQIVTMLMRYAASQGMDTSARGDLSAFPDGDSASAWAKEAVGWAVAENLLRGDDVTGMLDPQGGGTRAALATLIMRYDTMLPVG